ncbi:amine oxidase [Loa loa]|uniref:Amine oxidase n=1 Tax=Loa loa TaxID=7209 RepID=A0A1S0TYS8_LOALO|nr:amine oxidase [Loa loa]EFO21728.2 amine oxidase [Loa loa]
MRIVVIGAGPTGLGVTYRFHQLQNNNMVVAKNVELVVLEKELSPGGLSRTVMDENGFFWDMGGHVTFDHNLPYYKEAICWAVDEWNILTRNCQVDISYMFNENGLHLVPYPIQYAVTMFPANIKKKCLDDLRDRCKGPKDTILPKNFDDWIKKHFGPTLRNYFFKQYTQKVWTVNPDQMNPVWVGTRIAKMPYEKLEELCAMNEKDLKAIDIDVKSKLITYENERRGTIKLSYDVLISTEPIDQLIKHTKLCQELDLKYNKVFVIGIGLIKPMNHNAERFTWLYFPENTVPFYRVTFLSRYGEMTPDNDKYWSVLCECARDINDNDVTEKEITEKTIECLIRKSIISREQIVSLFSILLPYGYPIPTINRDEELTRAHRVLEKHEIYSRGRFGGWKYEVANQDHCFMQGKEIIDRILLGEPETVYKNGLSPS